MSAGTVVTVRTRKQCRKLIRDRASLQYTATTKDALLNLLDGTYNPKHGDSAEGYKITRTVGSLMKGLTIGLRQFERTLKRLQTDGILHDYSRENGEITYRLDLTPLESLEGIDEAEVKTARNANRAANAQRERAQRRQRHYVAGVRDFLLTLTFSGVGQN